MLAVETSLELDEHQLHKARAWAGIAQQFRLVMRDDGQPVDVSEIRVSANPREASLRDRNKRLKQDVESMRRQMEDLQHEKEVLEQMEEDAGMELLNQENDSLLKTLRQSREELQRLMEDVQSLKRSLQKKTDQRQNKEPRAPKLND